MNIYTTLYFDLFNMNLLSNVSNVVCIDAAPDVRNLLEIIHIIDIVNLIWITNLSRNFLADYWATLRGLKGKYGSQKMKGKKTKKRFQRGFSHTADEPALLSASDFHLDLFNINVFFSLPFSQSSYIQNEPRCIRRSWKRKPERLKPR